MASVGQPADSIEAEVFLQELHDALAHLRELPVRRGHPLCRRLGKRSPVSTTALHYLLLNAIEELRPAPQVEPDAPRWRRYHYLRLRYVEGARLGQVIAELGISERQARREHNAALQELAAQLLQTTEGGVETTDEAATQPAPGNAVIPTDREAYQELEAELTSLESSVEIEPMRLPTAVEDALDLVAPFAAARGVVFEYVPARDPLAIVASPTIVRQILLSALTYLAGIESTRRLRVSITDCGVGVEIHLLPVETRAARGPEQNSPTLPLLMASRLSEGQEAVLRTELLPSGGTAIRMRFLTNEAPLILVVDDNPGIVRLFRRYVRGEDLRLIQARNGIHAQQLARALRPDAIILDLMMPIQDGWDLFKSIRANPETTAIPVIACSVLPERDLALAIGADDFLAKPVSAESLLAALRPYRTAPRRRPASAETSPGLP